MDRYDGVTAGVGCERIRTIDPELLAHELRSGRPHTIVDVRRAFDFRAEGGHLPGARSIPLGDFLMRHDELDCHRSDPIVVVSQHDRRAKLGALELELLGFTDVRVLEGGMERWSELGLPVVHEISGAAP